MISRSKRRYQEDDVLGCAGAGDDPSRPATGRLRRNYGLECWSEPGRRSLTT